MSDFTEILVATGAVVAFAGGVFLFVRKPKARQPAHRPPPQIRGRPAYRPTPMDDPTFWSLIDLAVSKDKAGSDFHYDKLEKELRKLSVEGILGFAGALERALNGAYTQSLWGAAYLINGGCSDDGFEYFRGWLVAQGSVVYQRAVADPDSLAEYLATYRGSSPMEDEDLLNTAGAIFEEKTGGVDGYETDTVFPEEPSGEAWDFDDEAEMKRRLPKLTAQSLRPQ